MKKMTIYAIFAQRKCRYDGQYAPELLDAIDEFSDSDNPDFIREKFKVYTGDSDFESVAIIPIDVDFDAIKNVLNPHKGNIKGNVIANKSERSGE